MRKKIFRGLAALLGIYLLVGAWIFLTDWPDSKNANFFAGFNALAFGLYFLGFALTGEVVVSRMAHRFKDRRD